MKKVVKKLVAVIGYMLLLCILLKTEAVLLFSPRHIGMFLSGVIILCIPHLERKMRWKDFPYLFRQNAVTAGYLETFMLIFVSMMQGNLSQKEILASLALDLRPLFYGFVCQVVLKEETEEDKTLKEKGLLEQEERVLQAGESGGAKRQLDFSGLTRQEKVVAELVRQGLTNREIGEELCISEATVKKHMSNIFEKLEIGSRRELKGNR